MGDLSSSMFEYKAKLLYNFIFLQEYLNNHPPYSLNNEFILHSDTGLTIFFMEFGMGDWVTVVQCGMYINSKLHIGSLNAFLK